MPLTLVRLLGCDPNRRAVLFRANHGNGEVDCAVSYEAMDDAEHTRHTRNEEREAQFDRLIKTILEAASRKYFVNDNERAEGEILVTTRDLGAVPRRV